MTLSNQKYWSHFTTACGWNTIADKCIFMQSALNICTIMSYTGPLKLYKQKSNIHIYNNRFRWSFNFQLSSSVQCSIIMVIVYLYEHGYQT